MQTLRIGTRGSALALYQTKLVSEALCKAFPTLQTEVVEIKTLGDKKQGTVQACFGDKKDWVYELEMALLDQSIDLAIHSAKDVPGNTEPGLALLPVMDRQSPYDIFIGRTKKEGGRYSFEETRLITEAAGVSLNIGTASLRRKAALKKAYPQVVCIDHRGNVPTRIRKLDEDTTLAGIILAEAGVVRLQALSDEAYSRLSLDVSVPAMNQGILAAQFRESDSKLKTMLEALSSPTLQGIFFAERTVAEVLEGDCKTAIGIFAQEIAPSTMSLTCEVYNPHAPTSMRATRTFPFKHWYAEAQGLAQELLAQGVKALMS